MAENAGSPVRALRVVLTVPDFDRAVRFYRDGLGLPVEEAWDRSDGRGMLLAVGRATLELIDEAEAEIVDRTDVGPVTSGPVRLSFEVSDSAGTARELAEAGGEVVGEPVVTPWGHRNARVATPGGMQLTLFTPFGSA